MSNRNWHFPSVQRDLAYAGAGLVILAAFVGAGVGIALDVLLHRHRPV